jgi:hypothetical protein
MTSPVAPRCPICRADPETQIRFEERERIAAMVEALPVMTSYPAPDAHNLAYRYTTPRTVAAKIRGEA